MKADHWLNRKDVCQRCLSGVDDDHDGNCAVCARMDDETALKMKATRLRMEVAGLEIR